MRVARRWIFALLLFLPIACSNGGETSDTPSNTADTGTRAADANIADDSGECWWCVDAGDRYDTGPLLDPKDGGKTPGKGDATKTTQTWNMTLDLETGEGTYHYTAVVTGKETLVCDITYPIVSAVSNESCDECTFARNFTLGDAEATVKDNCSNQGNLGGKTMTYGHKDPDELYFYSDEKGSEWIALQPPVVMSNSSVEGTLWTFSLSIGGDGDGKDPGMTQSGTAVQTWSGTLNTKTGEGNYSYVISDDGGKTLTCDLSFKIASATLNETCLECLFAWNMPLGEAEIGSAGKCGDQANAGGTAVMLGHKAPNELFFGKQGSWYSLAKLDGESKVDGDEWTFSYSTALETDGGKGGDKAGDK
jgi:hypothetical protein